MNPTGPCLCGDPYCWQCGNPAEAYYGDEIDDIADKLHKADLTEGQIKMLKMFAQFLDEMNHPEDKGDTSD